MVATRVGSVRRVVCGSPAYFAGCGLAEGAGGSFLSLLRHVRCSGVHYILEFRHAGLDVEQTVTIRSRLSVNTADAAIDAAVAGVGVTRVLSYQSAKAIEQGKLIAVLEEFEAEPTPVSLAHAGQGLLPLSCTSPNSHRFQDIGVVEVGEPRIRDRRGTRDRGRVRGNDQGTSGARHR
ncbi:MAG: LysR family transcriptional regulator [Mesorhizobium sp.]|nr:MAG: LysR family transcriptional regulator [Mesorhizobium sp.]